MCRVHRACQPTLFICTIFVLLAMIVHFVGACHFHALTVIIEDSPGKKAALDEVTRAFAGDAPIPTLPTEDDPDG